MELILKKHKIFMFFCLCIIIIFAVNIFRVSYYVHFRYNNIKFDLRILTHELSQKFTCFIFNKLFAQIRRIEK